MLVVPTLCLHAQPPAEAPAPIPVPISAPMLVEELPRATRAPPDEVVWRSEAAGPVAPVERELRLVASDGRMTKGDMPDLSVGEEAAATPPSGTPPPVEEVVSPVRAAAVPARALARPDARKPAPSRQPLPIAREPAEAPAPNGHGRWLWLAPAAVFFLAVVGWLVWARGRRDNAPDYEGEDAVFTPAAREIPFRPGVRLGRPPSPVSPAPRRLADALAGLKAELGDGPCDEGGAAAVGHAG